MAEWTGGPGTGWKGRARGSGWYIGSGDGGDMASWLSLAELVLWSDFRAGSCSLSPSASHYGWRRTGSWTSSRFGLTRAFQIVIASWFQDTVSERHSKYFAKIGFSKVDNLSLQCYNKKQPFDLENRYLIDDRKLILDYGSHHDTGWCFPSKLSSSAHKHQRLAPRNKRQVGALTKSQFATSPLFVKVYCKFLRQPIGLQRRIF